MYVGMKLVAHAMLVQVRQSEGAVPRWLCHPAYTPGCLHTCQLDAHHPNRCVLQLLSLAATELARASLTFSYCQSVSLHSVK